MSFLDLLNHRRGFVLLPALSRPPQPTSQSGLLDLPNDVLFLIMGAVLPAWARAPAPNGPTWTVGDLKAPLDISVSADSLRSLALVCHRLEDIATPFLYRTVHMRDVDTVLALWATLSRMRPSNAQYIRHLLFGVELKDWDALCRVSNVVSSLIPYGLGIIPGQKPTFWWADGQALVAAHVYSTTPPITQRVLFDLVKRSVNVITDYYRCRDYLSKYGHLTLPLLRRLILMSEPECWFLDLHDNTENHNRTTLLEKVKSLSIVWGAGSPKLNSDLRLQLELLPSLEILSIYLHTDLLKGDFRDIPVYQCFDINLQLGANAQQLKTLDLSWRIGSRSPAWCYLGRAKHLICLPKLQNLVRLRITTQLLFRGLPELQRRLHVPNHEAQQETEDEYLSQFLGRLLPPSLQLLSLLEYWPDGDLGRPDSPETLDTEHEQGDWMEVRFRHESGPLEDETIVQTAHDRANLKLMRALCRLWLTEERAVELRPHNSWFYDMYIHRVLLKTVGLERMLSRRTKEGHEYSFVETVYLRGVKNVVHQKRP